MELKLSKNLKQGCYVGIGHMWSFKKLTLFAKEDLPNMDRLLGEIQEFIETAPSMDGDGTEVVPEGSIVIAHYGGGVYQRARVVKVITNPDTQNYEAVVEFIDYGDTATVSPQEIFPITPNSSVWKHPIYGISVTMWNVPDDLKEVDRLCESYLNLVKDTIGGQLELMNEDEQDDDGLWLGRLWVAKDKTWADLILESRKSVHRKYVHTYIM